MTDSTTITSVSFWRRQYYLLLAAVVFFTRIPVTKPIPDWALQLNRSARFLPLVGLGLGVVNAVVFSLAFSIWPQVWLALVLTTVVSVLLTGAFHEDGFADFCDGFGGGWTKEQVLLIMKDSRLGTYGVIGLGLLMTTKLSALSLLSAEQIPAALILGHCLSRSISASFMHSMDYVRDEVDRKFSGHSEPMQLGELTLVWLTGLLCLLWVVGAQALWVLLPLWGLKKLFSAYLQKRIGGYTGDCLGAVQQLAEVLIYLILSALWL
ncbi:cobalamin-5'-phosphate synthase [Oceanospirillum multiglobuliferum]|uniref:Adenosylcobinamide-GDP ribazoletransferase n=1 Tax=Oceanospirillum multiglobuliferum TaxID=64969 RepID=A0A1T4LBI0_9GAMM|nr:adenosylcobinamide-GDP ribazoletransferase [Oceanospirillum multiglobuliferum]OPX56724.1 hypothetical protein BTE48_02210 [Oceanospirillum multiglobuliferum]SJZ52016.1 cobalamin-5'-phosphate synthase [Oceanospirillum multiglobuliferum]